MKIPVPVGASALKSEIPKAGLYPGRLVACAPNDVGDGLVVAWEFRDAAGKTWTLEDETDAAAFGAVMAELGETREELDHTDAIGTEAMVRVNTFGGKKYAKVTSVERPTAQPKPPAGA